MSEDNDHMEQKLADVLARVYGLSATVVRVPAGTETDNFVAEDTGGRKWFVKVYRDRNTIDREQAVVDLAMFARAGGVPVPAVHRTITGGVIGEAQGMALSLWDYMAETTTAEDGLMGKRWENVGLVLGKLHRHLARHPAYSPSLRPATGIIDVARARFRFDKLIDGYQRLDSLSSDQQWALHSAEQRRSLLSQTQTILESLPPLTVQILHGDLASPNLLMSKEKVAAVIDFQPPAPQYLVWEIARIGCDPHTIMANGDWLTGLARLLGAYRQENPAAASVDLLSTVSVGCAYTMASTYPLAAPLRNPDGVESSLMQYGRSRHESTLLMLDTLTELAN